ncbi:MAG: hypothetical protein R3Y54_10165, partial [Eubacteriales bacterium]
TPIQQTPIQQTPIQQTPIQQAQPQASEYAEQAKAVAANSWSMAKDMLVAPGTGVQSCMKQANRQLSLALIAAQALLSGLFAMVMIGESEKWIKSMMGYWGTEPIFSTGRVVGTTAICSLIITAALFGILYGINSIFKLDLTIDQLLAATSVKSVGSAVLIVVAIVVSYVDIEKAMIIFYVGGLLGIFFLESAIKPYMKDKKVMIPYIMFVLTILMVIIGWFVIKQGLPYYFSEDMRDGAKELTKMLGDPMGFIMNEIF